MTNDRYLYGPPIRPVPSSSSQSHLRARPLQSAGITSSGVPSAGLTSGGRSSDGGAHGGTLSQYATALPELMSRRQAAAYLGVAEQTLAVWKTKSRYGLPVVKIGRLAKYRKADLDAFIQRRTEPA